MLAKSSFGYWESCAFSCLHKVSGKKAFTFSGQCTMLQSMLYNISWKSTENVSGIYSLTFGVIAVCWRSKEYGHFIYFYLQEHTALYRNSSPDWIVIAASFNCCKFEIYLLFVVWPRSKWRSMFFDGADMRLIWTKSTAI